MPDRNPAVANASTFTDYFITATVESPLSAVAAADELFSRSRLRLCCKRIQPFQEKVYGLTGVRSAVLKRRDTIYRQRGARPDDAGDVDPGNSAAGLRICAACKSGECPRDAASACAAIESPVTGRGRLWTGRGSGCSIFRA